MDKNDPNVAAHRAAITMLERMNARLDKAQSKTPEPSTVPLAAILTPEGKNAAAVYLGRLGGRKGGKARAVALSAKRRSEIARMGGKNRWKNKKDA